MTFQLGDNVALEQCHTLHPVTTVFQLVQVNELRCLKMTRSFQKNCTYIISTPHSFGKAGLGLGHIGQ